MIFNSHRRRRVLRALSTAIVTAVALPIAATAQQPNAPAGASKPDALENRVEKLEGDIGQILQILKAQQAGAAAPASNAQTVAPGNTPTSAPASSPVSAGRPLDQPPATLKPGAILEVWPLKPDFAETTPPGRSSGGFIDKGNYFQLENFVAEKSFESMRTNHVALRWSGFFRAKEPGNYVFTVELQKSEYLMNEWADKDVQWVTTLSIDQEPVVAHSFKFSPNKPVSYSMSAEANLEPGYYPLALVTLFHGSYKTWNYKGVAITVKVRGPSDMLPVALSPSNFLHKE